MDGPDIEVGTGDSKMKRMNLFPAFTKATERFRKLNKITIQRYVSCLGDVQWEKSKQTCVEEASKEK